MPEQIIPTPQNRMTVCGCGQNANTSTPPPDKTLRKACSSAPTSTQQPPRRRDAGRRQTRPATLRAISAIGQSLRPGKPTSSVQKDWRGDNPERHRPRGDARPRTPNAAADNTAASLPTQTRCAANHEEIEATLK